MVFLLQSSPIATLTKDTLVLARRYFCGSDLGHPRRVGIPTRKMGLLPYSYSQNEAATGRRSVDKRGHDHQGTAVVQRLDSDDDSKEKPQLEQPIVGPAYVIECSAHSQKPQRYETGTYRPEKRRIWLRSDSNPSLLEL